MGPTLSGVKLGIGIEANAAGIGIPAIIISVRCGAFRYRTGSSIVTSFHFGTGLTGCWTVRCYNMLKNSMKS
jgi:hypothetical protein